MDYEAFEQAMADLDEDTALALAEEAAGLGKEAADATMDAAQRAMQTIGQLFEDGEYFVGDLVYAGEIMSEIIDILKPALLEGGEADAADRMIICTVKGDLHDIGKNIVKAMLQASGFEVLDLGIDVAPEKIVETIRQTGISILALSGVLTLALESMKSTVEAISAAGLRDSVHIIIGGNPVSEDACAYVGADEWAHSPAKTIEVCKSWAKE